MKLAQLAAVLAALPWPLAAQDIVFDTAALDSCFAGGGWEDCIGESAGACMDASDMGQSTVGMVGCLDAEYRYWDDALNAAYARLVDEARAQDSATYDGDPPEHEDKLRAMQRAWIAWRDATCAYEVLPMWGGTGMSLLGTDCMMRMTGQQALSLQSRLASG